MEWITEPASLSDDRLADLVGCWTRVSNAGGAVGFPFLPVDESTVRAAAEDMRSALGAEHRLLVMLDGEDLIGWLILQLNTSPLTAHWAVVARVQTDLRYRGLGYARELLAETARTARSLGLEQLHIAVRGGQGIEGFYLNLGWQIVGRWPAALRLGPEDDRDDIMMMLTLAA